ncbi:unnamed protein product, partial [Prorocentrum cordatum]
VDTSFTCVGVDLVLQVDGAVCARPFTKAVGAGTGRMPFYSHIPMSMKRGFVLGAVARVRDYTRPVGSMAEVLDSLTRHLHGAANHPTELLEQWVSEGLTRASRV